MSDLSSASSSRGVGPIFAVMIALAGIVGGVIWFYWPERAGETPNQAPEPVPVVDPRLTFETPYANVHPDVKYVGDQACKSCHIELFESYAHHPMGQALAPIDQDSDIERYDVKAFNPFIADDLHYEVQNGPDGIIHREWASDAEGDALTEIRAAVSYSVGSGTRARSYLVNRDGYLFQSPITWFPEQERWDLSPGYEARNLHFNRPITASCLFCHTNYAEHVPGTVNRYREPIFQGFVIGCERCHGPGELHVKRHQETEWQGDFDETIVNPADLEHSLRESVCHQCHVQGEQRVLARGRSDFDYRPGLPLHLFLMDFVDQRNKLADYKFVSSVEQLRASRCYEASSEPNQLGCISCHDPHYHPEPEKKVAHYRNRCLQCHTEMSCGLPQHVRREQNAEDSCIACHMPKLGSQVNHTSITDHRIPRMPNKFIEPGTTQREPAGPDDLIPFARELLDPDDEEVKRNHGIALMSQLELAPPEPIKRQFAEKALPLLDRAVQRDPTDWQAQESRAIALKTLGRPEEAMAAFERILEDQPRAESTLHLAGYLALDLNRPLIAQKYLERAIEVNPWHWHYHHGLARASFRRGDWNRAIEQCRSALKLDPTNGSTRSLLVQCYLSFNQNEQAQREFDILNQLTPQDRRAELHRWYDEVRRRFAR